MAKASIPRCKLLERTIELLRNRPSYQTLSVVAADTRLHHRWLETILLPSYKGSPSVDSIVLLYEYLTSKSLQVD